MKRVAEWLRHWTRNLRSGTVSIKIRSSLTSRKYTSIGANLPPETLREMSAWVPFPVICKKPWVSFWIHTASVHLVVLGTRWNEKLVLCEWLQLQKMRCRPREMRLWKSEFRHLGVINVKSAKHGNIIMDYKHNNEGNKVYLLQCGLTGQQVGRSTLHLGHVSNQNSSH